jgi:uncharacterized protein YjcR
VSRQRSPGRDKAREIWLASGGSMKLCEIAQILGLPESSIRAWKVTDEWGAAISKKKLQNPL